MKNEVNIYFDISAISVDMDQLQIQGVSLSLIIDKLPSDVDFNGVKTMSWSDNTGLPQKGYISLSNGTPFLFGEDKYADYIQPYVDLWQAEKDRLEQEQIEAEQEYAKFENRKERALNTIQADYEAILDRGFVRTSLGFDADISPDSSATLIGSQINLVNIARIREGETPKTIFRDFYGLKRELDAVQVERLICEINGVQNYIRELKYTFKGAVKETFDNESLNACIETCVYSTLDYSNLDESGNPTVLPFVESKSIKDRIDTL